MRVLPRPVDPPTPSISPSHHIRGNVFQRGMTALLYAASDEACLRLMLDHGCDLKAKTKFVSGEFGGHRVISDNRNDVI